MTRTTAFALGVAATLLAAGVPTAWAQENDGSMQSDQLMRRIVSHTQGWGVMGVDVAAHAAGVEAMPLKIGEKAYTSGIGTHAPSETVLLLDGQYERLTAEVGVLPQGDSVGSVSVCLWRPCCAAGGKPYKQKGKKTSGHYLSCLPCLQCPGGAAKAAASCGP